MRALLSRHAAAIYIGGGIAFVLGVAGVGLALSAASLAGAAIGGALSASGLAAMGCTSRSVGA
jgi:hypothetical protein